MQSSGVKLQRIATEQVRKFEKLIYTLARYYAKMLPDESVLSKDDLFMEGMIVYLDIIDKYSEDRETKFSTYLAECIKKKYFTIVKREVKRFSTISYQAIPIHLFIVCNRNRGYFIGAKEPEDKLPLSVLSILSDEISFETKEIIDKLLSAKIPESVERSWGDIRETIYLQQKKLSKNDLIKALAIITDTKCSKIKRARAELRSIVNKKQIVQVA